MTLHIRDLLDPSTAIGAAVIAAIIVVVVLIAMFIVRRIARRIEAHLSDVTGLQFASRFTQGVFVVAGIVAYAHLIPELRSIGTALLAGVSLVSIVVGLAAQSTLGNLISGIALVLYRPLHVGSVLQVSISSGFIVGKVQAIGLGYTSLRDGRGQEVIVPNSVMATSVIIRLADDTPLPPAIQPPPPIPPEPAAVAAD
ncbi:MAG: mechanosensitive ion channel [Bauldia sp.]|nr:mechanosensitive ion channel [Bauldia sp.]